MQRVFLSYTYHPHPNRASDLASLQRTMRRVIEAMGLHVSDGEDLGGRALDAEIEKRISEADATIALYTPQADVANNEVLPEFVASEFQHARGLQKPTLRILDSTLAARGLGTADEYAPYQPDRLLDVVLKVMQTLALWKRDYGRPVQIQVQPDHLAERFGENRNDRCEYELLVGERNNPQAPKTTRLWPEPGAAYVYVPDFVDGAKVRVRLTVNGENWQSRFVIPQMGGVALFKNGV